jgi:hypothetical protein
MEYCNINHLHKLITIYTLDPDMLVEVSGLLKKLRSTFRTFGSYSELNLGRGGNLGKNKHMHSIRVINGRTNRL